MNNKKIDIHKTLKKHKLKPIELKSNKSDSKPKPEDKKEEPKKENNSIQKENEESPKETSFHESILEESIDFAKPAMSIEETLEEPEKKETLEETAGRISNPFQTSPITTGSSQGAYATGLNSGTYSGGPINQNSGSNYQSGGSVNPFLEKENRDRSIFGIPPSSNSSGFDSLKDEFELKQERYRTDQQSQQNTGLPFEEKRKKHEIQY